MAGAEGLDISSSARTPEENRNTTLNCCAQDSRIAFSLWRTQRKARSWRVGTSANRIQSALETVQLLLGPYEIYLLHCSFYLCHILVHKLSFKLLLLLFLFVEISFNHFVIPLLGLSSSLLIVQTVLLSVPATGTMLLIVR